ncbi:MAG: hypothetical protein KME17_01970 [Cyanosarcina radialis HA8281-LM2]|jgi:hypothetical protein|nr:hypothetical protein [Cyanosarcina radialis HA8281-LM2]
MANLPNETVTIVFNLQRQLWELIDRTTGTTWAILEQYGETDTTVIALEQLENSTERLTSSYSRLYNLMLRIGEAQPMADSATLNLLLATIAQSQAIVAAVEASVREARRDFDLP